MFCDLHTHTIFSDGTSTPQELIDGAIAARLGAIALTDHNTVQGLPEFMAAANGKNIDIVLGSEFSVNYGEKELHLLGLFIDPKYFSQITDLMKSILVRKEKSNVDLVGALGRVGIRLDYDEIKASAYGVSVNRAHIASALMQGGYVSSIAEAFERYLSPKAGFYKEPRSIDVWEMMDYLKSIGAVTVLAHPYLKLDDRDLVTFLKRASKEGLDGMECFYSTNDEATTARSIQLAEEYGILKSGGSDYHGTRKPNIELGVGRGNLEIPYEWYLRLKEKAKAI